MIDKLKKLIHDSSLVRFAMVGVLNTIVGPGTMVLLYNCIPWGNPDVGYWIASACNYLVGGICSYFLNKYFTFRSKERSGRQVLAFVLEQGVCYLLAYGMAKPLVLWAMSGMEQKLRDNAAMLVGMCLFVLLNYFGQKLFVFKDKKESQS